MCLIKKINMQKLCCEKFTFLVQQMYNIFFTFH